MIDRLQNATFDRRIFLMHPVQRFVVRVVSSAFFMCCLGLAAALLISETQRLVWAGALLVLILVDYLLHMRRPHYALSAFMQGRVRHNNIALCINRSGTHALVSALDMAISRKADLGLCMMQKLASRHTVLRALERLEIQPEEFHDRLAAAVEQSVQKGATFVREAHVERIRQLAVQAAASALLHGKEFIGIESLFTALARLKHPAVLRLLDFYSVTADDIDAALVFGSHTRGSTAPYLGGFAMKHGQVPLHRVNRSFTSRPTPVLDSFSVDVTDYVRDGYGGFLIGHREEFERLEDAASRPGMRNVLLVGEPGTGKEALVYHLAYRIVSDAVPSALYDRRVVQVSLSGMLSGATAEQASGHMQKVSEEILHAGNILLYIPDAHLLEKSAAAGTLTLADVFLPILKSGAFPVVAATTPQDYRRFIELHPALADAFEVIRVGELSPQDAIRLLSYSALLLEKKYRVKISCAAVSRAVLLASKYLRKKPLPASAQELLQEAVIDASQQKGKQVRAEQVVSIVERKLHVPVRMASGMEAAQLLKLEDTIHEAYINQDEAVTAVANSLRTYRSGLGRKEGPIASFLFVGPTGVGKTELTKILAKLYFGSESFLIRFDMSEYQEKDAVARFIGSSDGKLAGQLTESVLHQPYSVVLLDEFEKAHPDILNLFLQVLDEGRLTDSSGRLVDFRNTIIIATSNAHSVLVQKHVQEHGDIAGFAEELKKRLSEYFRPELINRFSDVITFKPLSRDSLAKIVALQLQSLAKQISEAQGISLAVTPAAQQKIAELGYAPEFGARPLRKAIDSAIKSPLSQKILSQELGRGDGVQVDVDGEGKFTFEL
jgi:ATP-dependent Clp protease ATP-binding subunit ClpC